MLMLKEAVTKLDSLLDAGITVTMLYSEEGTSVKTDFSPTAIRAAVCDAMLAAVEDCHDIECRPGIFREPPHPLSSCSACRSRAAILAAFQQAARE